MCPLFFLFSFQNKITLCDRKSSHFRFSHVQAGYFGGSTSRENMEEDYFNCMLQIYTHPLVIVHTGLLALSREISGALGPGKGGACGGEGPQEGTISERLHSKAIILSSGADLSHLKVSCDRWEPMGLAGEGIPYHHTVEPGEAPSTYLPQIPAANICCCNQLHCGF